MACMGIHDAMQEGFKIERDIDDGFGYGAHFTADEADRILDLTYEKLSRLVYKIDHGDFLSAAETANAEKWTEELLALKQKAVLKMHGEKEVIAKYADEVAAMRSSSAGAVRETVPAVSGFESDTEMWSWYTHGRDAVSEDHTIALSDWVGEGYGQAQGGLKETIVTGLRQGSIDATNRMVRDLDAALSDVLDRELTVYRGVDMPDWFGKFKPGDVVSDKSWQATATKSDFVDGWVEGQPSPIKFEIHLSPGQHFGRPELFGEYAEDWLAEGKTFDEFLQAGEVLLPRNTQMRVLDAETFVTKEGKTGWLYKVVVEPN